MENSINKRIELLIKELGYKSIRQFAIKIDVAPTSLNDVVKNNAEPKFSTINKIVKAEPSISPNWLITGEGEMLKEKAPSIANTDIFHGEKLIPLYRNEAAAGFGTADFAIKDTDIEGYYKIKEFMNADFMLHVRGDSMLPLYKPGDTIAVREIKECKFIQWGKPHLISARYQGLLIKRLYAGDREDEVKAVSENREVYPPFKIPLEEITGIALVIGTVRLDNF